MKTVKQLPFVTFQSEKVHFEAHLRGTDSSAGWHYSKVTVLFAEYLNAFRSESSMTVAAIVVARMIAFEFQV